MITTAMMIIRVVERPEGEGFEATLEPPGVREEVGRGGIEVVVMEPEEGMDEPEEGRTPGEVETPGGGMLGGGDGNTKK